VPEHAPARVRAFAGFLRGSEGRAMLERAGFMPVDIGSGVTK